MRILVVTHYFPPEIGAPQARLSEMARVWAESGQDVTVLTGMPNHPTGVVPKEYRGAIRRVEHVDGYRVLRTWLYATPNDGFVKKTIGHLSFMVSSVALGAASTGRPDVVVVSSPTFFSIFSAYAIAKARRARLVVEIRDLWPAIFVELGVLTNRTVIRILETIELGFYDAADAVVVVTEGFRDNLIARGVDAGKIHTIRNGVDLDRFSPRSPDEDVSVPRKRLGASDGDTLVLYIGAHGISHGLTAIADAAARVQDAPIHFAFVGEGAAKADLEARVHELGLDNVTMLPGVPRDEVPALLAAADICLVPLRDVPLFTTFIPSKIFEYLGAGKAVIGSVRGEPATILRDAGAIVVEPEDAAALADAVRDVAGDPGRRAAMATEGRAYVQSHFDRRQLALQYLDVMHDVDERPRPIASRTPAEQSRALLSFVWGHPQVRSEGTAGRVKALGRVVGWQAWQRLAKRPITVTMVGGSKLRCHPHSHSATGVLYTRLPEYEDMRFVLDHLAAGDTFVDVGANVGTFTLLAASVPGVTCRSYEPSTDSRSRLAENVALNRYEDRVTMRPVAVGASPGTVQLSVGADTTNRVVRDGSDGRAGSDTAAPIDGARGVEAVAMVTLDDDLADAGRVALMKIDVEGLEEQVLEGARGVLERQKPALIIEANDHTAIRSVLEPLGYAPYRYDVASRQLLPAAWEHRTGNNLLALADVDDARARLRAGLPR